jgi:hypothetical protein
MARLALSSMHGAAVGMPKPKKKGGPENGTAL